MAWKCAAYAGGTTLIEHCLWHLTESESWAPRDNLLQHSRKGGSRRGCKNKQQLVTGIGQAAGKEVGRP